MSDKYEEMMNGVVGSYEGVRLLPPDEACTLDTMLEAMRKMDEVMPPELYFISNHDAGKLDLKPNEERSFGGITLKADPNVPPGSAYMVLSDEVPAFKLKL